VVTRCTPVLVLLTAIALALAAASVPAPRAAAAPGIQFGLTDDGWLQNGPGTVSQRVATLDGLGVQVVRYTLNWNQIAASQPAAATDPSDRAYDWTNADTVVDALRARGITVVLQLLGTPSWANRGLPSNYAPTSGATFAAFATAAARHYPWVTRWLIWNEPNQIRWLRPTSASIYTTRLLNPAYAAIHSVIHGAQVGGGVTAPRGSTGGVSPVAWLTAMHNAHARLDAYAYNPYPLDPKRESPLAGGCATCSTITMSAIGRLTKLVAADFGRARVWLTEYGYQTNPPDSILGVSQPLQARYIGEAAYQAYRTGRIDMLIHYLYRDEPNLARFQSGLVTVDNTPKAAYAAFQLPLAQIARRGSTVTLWGQLRAPGAGATAHVQRRLGSRWVAVATVRAAAGSYWTARAQLAPSTWVRVVSGRLIGSEVLLH
jgi:hypothetical protein